MTQAFPIRYRVVFLSFVVSALLYLDRFVLSYVERYIKADLSLTEDQISWGLSAFFWSYALTQVPSGWLTDRFGPRRMLTIYILAWSVATAAMGWVNGLAMLLFVRLAMGLAQAGAYPACASIVGRWVPVTGRGLANAVVTFGGRLGGGLAPLLTATLVMLFAARATTPVIGPGDVLRPLHVADQISLAIESEGAASLSEENQTRRTVLQRVSTEASQEELASLRAFADGSPGASAQQEGKVENRAARIGSPPPDLELDQSPEAMERRREAADLCARILDRALQGPLLLSPEELKRLPVEREARLAVERGSVDSEQALRINRLILEAVLSGGLRQIYSHGWRPVMWTFGAFGVLVAFAYWFVIRDRPASHPRMTPGELEIIDEGRLPVPAASAAHRLPIEAMLTSRSLWLISLLQFCTNIGWTFLVLQLPKYLLEAQNCSLEDRSWHSAFPLWAGWGGMFLGGWFTDWCVRRFGLRIGRMLPLTGTRFLAAAAFGMMLLEPSLWTATAMFCLVAFSTDVGVPAVWAYNQDVGGRYIASVLGWGNMWGNIGSALSPLLLNAALKHTGDWNVPFLICAIAFGLAGLCGLFIDATRPIDNPHT